MSTDTELVLEDVVIDLLADPESAMEFYREHVTSDFLIRPGAGVKGEKNAIRVLDWVTAFIDKYGKAPDVDALNDEFDGAPGFFETPHPASFIIEKLRKRYAANEVKGVLKHVSRNVGDEPLAVVEYTFSEMAKIKANTSGQGHVMEPSDWRVNMETYNQRIRDGNHFGITFGYSEMDKVLGGLRPGLYFNAGRLKRFKSWLTLIQAIEAARHGHNAVFYSLEMPADETTERMECLIANVSYSRRRNGLWFPEDKKIHEDKMEEWNQLADDGEHGRLVISHPPLVTRTVQGLIEDAKQYDADVIYIDQFKYIRSSRAPDSAPKWEKAEYICEDLKTASDALPIVVATQLNRQAKDNKGGGAEEIAVSDAIPQHADMILRSHQTQEMRDNTPTLLEWGVMESRSTDHGAWVFAVELNDACRIRLIERKQKDD